MPGLLDNPLLDGIDRTIVYAIIDVGGGSLLTQQIAYDQGLSFAQAHERLIRMEQAGVLIQSGPPGPFASWHINS